MIGVVSCFPQGPSSLTIQDKPLVCVRAQLDDPAASKHDT